MIGGRPSLWLALLAAMLVFLTSCGSNTRVPELGTLTIQLAGADSAEVLVQSQSGSVFTGLVTGAHAIELAPGNYRVDGMPQAGRLDPTNTEVQVLAGRETRVVLEYQATPNDPDDPVTPSAPVAGLAVLNVKDTLGSELPRHEEENADKDVWLYAAQTEESVCVSVRASDAAGAPVAGALVTVQLSDAFQDASDRIAVIRGCAEMSSGSAMSPQSLGGLMDSVMTGADGAATFTLYATSGYPGGLGEDDVAKIVVSTSNPDGGSVLNEFKIWFANITHLYFNGSPSGQRVGGQFEEINLWDSNDRKEGGAQNAFEMLASVYQKQPQDDIDLAALGYLRYDILSETGQDGNDADVAHLENCDPSGGNSCVSYDGSARLVPNAGIWLEDLPISAQVRVTLVVYVQYGNTRYEFELKSVDVRKTWVGSHLAIDKRVDHHVLTWYGDNDDMDEDGYIEYTLDPANAVPADSAFTATFTITATNTGQSPVYDVTITDGLPAELGVLEETLNPSGGTYDSINHAVTWNYQTSGRDNPRFNELAPGESITVSLEVYLRQKPGFCVDEEDLFVSANYMVGFTFGDWFQDSYCYDDPYDVVNGGFQHDVTASWFVNRGGTSAVVDFHGFIYEDQVIVWGVRPIFTLDKRLVNTVDLPFDIGMDALFDITIVNEHRIIYDELEADYPGEFNGDLRANPYGRSIYLLDGFTEGLDFTSAGPLTVNGAPYASTFVGDPTPPPPFAPYLLDFSDKLIVWEVAPLMDYRSEASTRIVLDNDLAGVHVNLAAFTTGNLNQLEIGDCGPYFPNPDVVDDFLASSRYAGFSGMIDCAFSTVLEPNDPFIELSAFPALNIEGLDLSRQTVVERGDEFIYVFAIQNGGSGAADDTVLEVELDNRNAELRSATQYVLDTSLSIVATIPGSFDDDSASFGPYDHPVGFTAIFVMDAEAKKVGDNSATAVAGWNATRNDTQYGLLPLEVKETVSIKPPTP